MSLFCDCSQDHARQKPYNPSESRRGRPISPSTPDDMRLEIWETNGAKDVLCRQYKDQIFPVNQGPIPVKDTHLNCKCRRVTFDLEWQPSPKPKKRKTRADGTTDWTDLSLKH